MPPRKHRRWPYMFVAILIAVVAIAVLFVAGDRPVRRKSEGWFVASDYPKLFAQGGWSRYGLPASLPANASGVEIYAPASAPSRLPAPDQHVRVTFTLTPAEAQALLASAQAVAVPPPPGISSGDDESPGGTKVILANPGGSNMGGVTVDVTSGTVEYWIVEF